MSIKDNYETICENMALAAQRAGRGPDEVKLLAVTKFVPVERIAEAVALGVNAVGENRVQEYTSKLDFFRENELETHLIGQLQTNKVKYIIGKVDLIQSVDRLALAQVVSRLSAEEDVTTSVLLEVNIGQEQQKGGVPVEELPQLLEQISALPNILVKGLMCIPPAVGEREARGYLKSMRRLFEGIAGASIPNVSMEQLSMGMSGDYMPAIEEGATMVRIGTALFGTRT